jgi:AcrR family transcriptional regulator
LRRLELAKTKNIPKSDSGAAQSVAPGRGRPRTFCTEQALDAAMKVFWRKGYEGTTLPDLERAIGVNRPSLYAAFGNKQALFRKVIERYGEGPACFVREAVELPTARQVVQHILSGSIDLVTNPKNPGGCLAVQGALVCGDEATAARKQLASMRAAGEELLRRRFERAKADGDLPRGTTPADLARYVVTVMHGISVEAAGGASRRALQRVADLALRAWSED